MQELLDQGIATPPGDHGRPSRAGLRGPRRAGASGDRAPHPPLAHPAAVPRHGRGARSSGWRRALVAVRAGGAGMATSRAHRARRRQPPRRPLLSVVLPAHDEAGVIDGTLARIAALAGDAHRSDRGHRRQRRVDGRDVRGRVRGLAARARRQGRGARHERRLARRDPLRAAIRARGPRRASWPPTARTRRRRCPRCSSGSARSWMSCGGGGASAATTAAAHASRPPRSTGRSAC